MPGAYDPHQHHRRSLRLRDYDYTQPGMYFVTICTSDRACCLGTVVGGAVLLSDAGRIVERAWSLLPQRFPGVDVDAFVVMPNHIHGILLLRPAPPHANPPTCRPPSSPADERRAGPAMLPPAAGGGTRYPLPSSAVARPRPVPPPAAGGAVAGTLGAVVGSFKATAAKRINARRATPGATIWQRNYYEHVIRNDEDLARIRRYIDENPLRWNQDEHHPSQTAAPTSPPPPHRR